MSAPTAPLAQTAPKAEEEQQDWQGLPPGKGREEVFYACGPCHSLKLVTQQGLTRASWDEVLHYMVEEQAMAPLDKADRKLILDYLAEFYSTDRKALGGKLPAR